MKMRNVKFLVEEFFQCGAVRERPTGLVRDQSRQRADRAFKPRHRNAGRLFKRRQVANRLWRQRLVGSSIVQDAHVTSKARQSVRQPADINAVAAEIAGRVKRVDKRYFHSAHWAFRGPNSINLARPRADLSLGADHSVTSAPLAWMLARKRMKTPP